MAENIQKVILTADNRTKAAFSAFRSDVTEADKSVLALEKSSTLLKTGLATLGVSLSGAAFAGMIKGVADAQDKLAKLSASTGIAVDTLAGLQFAAEQSGTSVERVGKAVTNFSRIVLESNGETDKYSRLIKALGLDLESLKSATPEQQFISLAGAIKDNVAEQDRAAVVTSLLGARYTELIPLLSQGEQGLRDMIARGKDLNPVTKESAAAAELFNDKMHELTLQMNSFKVEAGNKVIPVLAEIAAEMANAARQSGIFAGVLAGLKSAVTQVASSGSFGQGILGPLGYLAAREKALKDIEDQAKETAEALDEIKTPDIKDPPRSFVNILKEIDEKSEKASVSTKKITKSLSEEDVQAKKTADRIEQLTLKFDPLIAYNKELNELISLRASGLPDSVYSAAVAESIDKYTKATGGVADGISEIDEKTRQLEITTRQVFDTNEQIAINGIRGIQNTIADGLFNAARNGMDGMVMAVRDGLIRVTAEFASARLLKGSGIGALFGLESGSAGASGGGVGALNIASLGNSALNLARGGFGLTSLAGNTALQLGQMTGIQSLTNFGAGAVNPALASFVTEGAGGFAASAGSAFSSFAGPAAIAAAVDIGLRSIFGDKKLGGTAGDVLGYVPIVGTLINGLFGRGAPKFQNEALVGNVSAGGFEGVLNQAFREKGGLARSDRVSNFIADTDTGNLLNQFGRLSESGNIPGALRDSATDPAVKRALEVGKFLDEAFGSIGDTLKETAEKLGLSSDALNNFSAELDLVSEKGETLSEAQISEEINRITDAMIETLIPNLDELAKKGETSGDTLTRLNAQFSVLQTAAEMFGNTSEQAAEKVRGLGLDGQTALIDRLGGAENAAAQFSEFYNTVFTDAQKLDYVESQIFKVLDPLEIDFIPTLEQLYDAIASGNPDLVAAALAIDGLVSEAIRLRQVSDQVIDASTELPDVLNHGLINGDALAKLEKEADGADRALFKLSRRISQLGQDNKPTIAISIGGKIFTETEIRAMQQTAVDGAAQAARSAVQEQLRRLDESMRSASDMFKEQISAVDAAVGFFSKFKEDALAVSNSSFAASRAQLDASIALAKSGADLSEIDTPELAKAIDTLKQDRSNFFADRKSFELDKAATAQQIETLSLVGQDKAQQTIDILTDQLTMMQQSYDVQVQQLNGTLQFIDFQSGLGAVPGGNPSLIGDAELAKLAAKSLGVLNENERIQRNTTFNGAVQFAFPTGQNQSADALDRARVSSLNDFIGKTSGQDITSTLQAELKELRKQTESNSKITQRLYDLMHGVTEGGRAMKTEAV
ncbi:MAG: hypothetical protein KDI07_15825 [Anaerolineae bacterium]|nr:hypothetical protein [Anaerolineae bacterium]